MKKKILSLAIAALAAVGFMASAQTQQNKMYSPSTFTDFAFEGVLLDLPQQQRIDSLHAALRTPSQKKVHAITMSPDSAKAMPQRDGGRRPERMKGGAMGVIPGVEYVAKVKEILTPEQFDTFLSNIQTMPDNAINNLLPTPQGRQHPAMNGKPGKMGEGKCTNAQAKQCDGKKCDKGCDKKCDKACDGQKCMTGSDNCTKANCKADKMHKDKKSAKAPKDKKAKK